jgi:hypothetical protein
MRATIQRRFPVKGSDAVQKAEEGVPILTRARGLARAALEYLDDDRGDLLTALLHPDFFDMDKEYRSFVARASLAVLRGYLRGCLLEVQMEAQMEANARAYAEAKVKEERGVGFRPRG